MIKKFLVGGLLASAMVVPAFAQSTVAPATTSTMSSTVVNHADLWRSSKLIGVNVYNDNNDKLGDISEVLIDKTGKVAGVVIGVGGFLGMGQHDIMVDMAKLKFVNEPVRTSSTTTTTTGAASDTRATTTTATRDKWYPDHAVLSGATKDSLKAMQEFKYN